MVNLLEQPYARSLIHCDVPVNQTEEGAVSGMENPGKQHQIVRILILQYCNQAHNFQGAFADFVHLLVLVTVSCR